MSLSVVSAENMRAFNALASGRYGNFALLHGEFEGEEADFIVVVDQRGDWVHITPIAVFLTDSMLDRCYCLGVPVGADLALDGGENVTAC